MLFHSSAKEINSACQQVLLHYHESDVESGDYHLFENVLDHVEGGENSLPQQIGFHEKMNHARCLAPSSTDYCLACACIHAYPVVDVDMSGLPCTDFSSVGGGLEEEGPSIWVHIVYCIFQRWKGTPLLILENVRRMPLGLLELWLGDMYLIYSIDVQPSDVGYDMMNRPRVYRILCHRTHCAVTSV
jgi:site-specific DNA-cytosine methylase